MNLAPCTSCRRHVRTSPLSVVCPFCGATIAAVSAASPPRASVAKRLSRAAVFAGATLTACTPAPQPPHAAPPPPRGDGGALAVALPDAGAGAGAPVLDAAVPAAPPPDAAAA